MNERMNEWMERFTAELIRYQRFITLATTALELFVGCDGQFNNAICIFTLKWQSQFVRDGQQVVNDKFQW